MSRIGSRDIDVEGEALGTVKREVNRDESAAGHDDNTRASQFNRQLLRCRCLTVMNLINDEREDLTRADLDKFSSIIQEVERLHELGILFPFQEVSVLPKKKKKPREQVAAAESHFDEGITAAEFVNCLLNEYGQSPGGVAHQDNDEIVVCWIDIGLAIVAIFSKAYGCSTM
ncbi:hypothetical protein CJ030_MR1G023599 [Morella rubra]|uniref:Non-structural maintenance of chromosomes element 4 n=1 Tax=Morella rubra TaxID=262757 RepID=A0A6A1WNU5_9ROSI|nr:hypothetical protein CJ030_MR1G023599 [Morella rubra]